MKIVWHSNSPWMPTGYGQQTALFAPRIAALGHDVAISSYCGLQGHPMEWNGLTVWPNGQEQYSNDVLLPRAANHFAGEPGAVLTLCDVWVLTARNLRPVPTACWFPVDCTPLSTMDREWFEQSGATPLAMSRHAQRMLIDAGHDPHYVPHGVDTAVFAPADRTSARNALGVPADAFVIGMNAANKGTSPSRKAFAQQFEAFARLHRKHSDVVLFCHTQIDSAQGLDLAALVDQLGINDAVVWPHQYAYASGHLNQTYVAAMYNACDVVTNASYAEGFGLAIVEAQACGTPVVVTDASSMPELCGAGWVVGGDRYWHAGHKAWWRSPNVTELARTYEKAYQGGAARRRVKAREFALAYDVDRVLEDHWVPALKTLEQAAETKAA